MLDQIIKKWKKNWKTILPLLIIGLIFVGLLVAMFFLAPVKEEIDSVQFREQAEAGNIVGTIESPLLIETIEDMKLINGKFKDSGTKFFTYDAGDDLYEFLNDQGLIYHPKVSSNIWSTIVVGIIVLIGLIIVLFFLRKFRRDQMSQLSQFGKAKVGVRKEKPTVGFKNVGGVTEAVTELQEVVDFLRYPERFSALGARIPRGVLLVGPPGTGKTLLARAVAAEAGVPFFPFSGSGFMEMLVGVGPNRVKDLYNQAKKNAPAIVFIDEIDSIGKHRGGGGFGSGHDEREQTLNQICVELDGFDDDPDVIVITIAATNRPDILDLALLRPGRFDRTVTLDLPLIKGRKEILEIHKGNKPFADEVSLEEIARQTVGFSGADLANLLNEAAILAARRNKKTIGNGELVEAIARVVAGPECQSRIIPREEKEIAAYHEVGHALVASKLPNADPVSEISIKSRMKIAGYTMFRPKEDRRLRTRSEFCDKLAVLLGGFTAEKLIFGEVSDGSKADLDEGTRIAYKMITEYGMSEKLGPRTFGKKQGLLVFSGKEISEERNYSDETAREIDEELSNFIEEAFDKAKKILSKNRLTLKKTAEELFYKEVLEGEELQSYLNFQSRRKSKKAA